MSKDQRDRIIKERARIVDLENALNMAIDAFKQVGCRYREGGWCKHPRHMMKKYPQHKPMPKDCLPNNCPRN